MQFKLRLRHYLFFFSLISIINQSAGEYPEKSIRLIVPFATGGSSEIIARSIANSLTKQLGQAVYVENKPGGAGNIAMEEAKRANPDGYTLILGHIGTLAANPALFGKRLPYDPNKDFIPITLVAKVPNVIAVSNQSDIKNLKDFSARAKKNPYAINFGSAGNGSAGHLAMAYFASEADIKLVHVPYKGSGSMMTDLIAGQIQATFNGLPSLVGQIKAGTIKPIAIGSLVRSSVLPTIPTISELGFKGFETSQWYGLLAPANTPKPIINRLYVEIKEAMKHQDETRRMTEDGAILIANTPEEFARLIKSEQIRWGRVIHKSQITMD